MRSYIFVGTIFLLILVIAVEVTYLLAKPKTPPSQKNSATKQESVVIERNFDCQDILTTDPNKEVYAYNRGQLCWLMGTLADTHISTTMTQTFKGKIDKITKGQTETNETAYMIHLAPEKNRKHEINSFFIAPRTLSIGQMTTNGKSEKMDILILKSWRNVEIIQTTDLSKPMDTNITAFEIKKLP